MDYFDMLTEQRIDSETADLVDALLAPERARTMHKLRSLSSSRIFRKTRIISRTIGKIGWNRRSV